jgi:hypothetical protein
VERREIERESNKETEHDRKEKETKKIEVIREGSEEVGRGK